MMLELFLQLYVNERQTDQAYYLLLAVTAYSNTPHSSIKCSPNMYNYKWDLYLGTQLCRQGHPEIASDFIKKLTTICSNTHTTLHAAQEAQKCSFDKKKGVPMDFYIGDWVWPEAKT